MSAKPLETATLDGLYERDFALWCDQTARLLCAGQIARVDIEHLVEEVRDMGISQWHEMDRRLQVLLAHLLKWDRQPEKRSRSWLRTMRAQRVDLRHLFRRSPSLRAALAQAVVEVYPDAVGDARFETRLPASAFPSECPYTLEQIMDFDFPPVPESD